MTEVGCISKGTPLQVPISAVNNVDANVLRSLPGNVTSSMISIHDALTSQASLWTRTARLVVIGPDGIRVSYFLKVSSGPTGLQMSHSEHTAMSTIAACMPNFIPKPIAHGRYASDPTLSFFLSEYREMNGQLQDEDMNLFTQLLARMHKIGVSPNGKFGFHVPTFHGTTQIEHPWCDTWEEYFTVTTRRLLKMELADRGSCPKIEELKDAFFERVVPRLLGPLEGNIKPSLIHGDLWHGNATTDRLTGQPLIFDAGCLYAHNEYELGVWRQAWNHLGYPPHFEQYLKHFPKSAPEEDFDARNQLYAVVDILDSYLYKNETQYREKYEVLYII